MKCENFLNIKLNSSNNFTYFDPVQKQAKAFDTETREGVPFLLCDSDKNVITEHKEMYGHLLKQNNTVNLFYNLAYDASAILKTLPEKNLEQFIELNYTIYDNIYFSMLGSKCFEIGYIHESADNPKKQNYVDLKGEIRQLSYSVKFFDLWQFFKYEPNSSLDAVSKKYLNDSKIPITELGYDMSNLPIDDTVIDYCIHDAELTKRLADIVISACNETNIFFNTPYSTASLSMDYFYNTISDAKPFKCVNPLSFLINRDNIVNKRNYEICYYAYNSYYGGRNEVTKRGYFEEVYEYDVNSMYPYTASLLEDVFLLSWFKIKSVKELLNFDIDTLAYGFFECNIKVPYNYILPLPVKDGVLKYKYGSFKNYYTTLEELKTIVNLGLCNWNDIEIIKGWIGQRNDDNPPIYPFRDTINLLYHERAKYQKTDFRNLLYKIILNSFYGKFIEVNNKICIANKQIDLDDVALYKVLDNCIISKEWVSGKYFNPVYAAYITALGRCKVFEAAYQAGSDFIATFTDSVLSTRKLNIDVGDKLGQWEGVRGSLFMVGGGFYVLEGEQEYKFRTRGVHVRKIKADKELNISDFKDIFNHGYNETRVLKIKEAYRQHRLQDFNTFQTSLKQKDLNFDTKREWDYQYKNIDELFKIRSDSRPFCIA